MIPYDSNVEVEKVEFAWSLENRKDLRIHDLVLGIWVFNNDVSIRWKLFEKIIEKMVAN